MTALRWSLLAAALVLAPFPVAAAATCYEPYDRYLRLPDSPVCSRFGGIENCNSLQIQGYRYEIEQYRRELYDYARQVVAFTECESDRAVEVWNEFIGQ